MVILTLDDQSHQPHSTITPPLRCRPLPSPPYRIQGVGFMLLLDSCSYSIHAHARLMLVLDPCSTYCSGRENKKNHGISCPNHCSSLLLASHLPCHSSSFPRVALSGETRVFVTGPGCGCHDAVAVRGWNGRSGESGGSGGSGEKSRSAG